MKKIRNIRELEHRLEIVEIQRGIELEKVKDGIQKTKNSLVPTAASLSFSAVRALFKKKKEKR